MVSKYVVFQTAVNFHRLLRQTAHTFGEKTRRHHVTDGLNPFGRSLLNIGAFRKRFAQSGAHIINQC